MALEVVLFAGLTTVWWASSVTILLPFVLLLKYSKSFQQGWFSWLYTKLLNSTFQRKQVPYRKRCFEMLKEELGQRNESVPLQILEIGIGGGGNLEFYPENSSLIAVDMNPTFEKYFEEGRHKYTHVKLEKLVLAMAEDMHEIPDNSIDVVISTYVLCSVTNIQIVLGEVQRVLIQGGKFVFLEHVAFPTNQWGFTVQRMVSPLWSIYFAGCETHRNIENEIETAGFSHVKYEKKEPPDMMLFIRPQIIGVATK